MTHKHSNSHSDAHSDSHSDYKNERIALLDNGTTGNAAKGTVGVSKTKTLWMLPIYLVAIIGGYLTFSWEAFFVFLGFTAFTLCFGHSLGMHRLFIHKSYATYKPLEYFMVHLGVLVGLAGPLGMLRTHDLRDWAQRQSDCHAYFGHKSSFFKDGLWQIFYDITLDEPPVMNIEPEIADDKVYQWMEKYWMWQQLPWAMLLFALGGISWVVWGIFVRVGVSVLGHWLIGYFAHNDGHRDWHVEGADVQGFNVRFASFVTFGESWHNNHHAFPGSALLGIQDNQPDPGWWALMAMKKVGLAWNIKTHEDLAERRELVAVSKSTETEGVTV